MPCLYANVNVTLSLGPIEDMNKAFENTVICLPF